MTPQVSDQSQHSRLISAKANYSRSARKKLIESRAKLNGVNAAIRQAIITGRLKSSDQLERAQRAIEINLAAAEARLEMLQKSGEHGWEELRDQVDSAWEDLSSSIKKLVARISDESR